MPKHAIDPLLSKLKLFRMLQFCKLYLEEFDDRFFFPKMPDTFCNCEDFKMFGGIVFKHSDLSKSVQIVL